MKSTDTVVAVPDAERAGAIVWWRMSGEVVADDLSETWSLAGLDEDMLPNMITPEAALRRTMVELQSRHRLARALRRGRAFAIVDEVVTSGDDAEAMAQRVQYRERFRVGLDKVGRLQCKAKHPNNAFFDEVERIKQRFAHHLEHHSPSDVSGWLIRIASTTLKAIRLRDTGGIYFIPRDAMPEWRKIVNALHASTDHRLFEVPALRTNEAVEAILDAVRREAAEAIAGMDADLKQDIGRRALESRAEACNALANKLETYERLLGTSLEDIRKKTSTTQARVSAAILVASGKDVQ